MYHNVGPLPGNEHIISTQFSRPKFVARAWTTALALLVVKSTNSLSEPQIAPNSSKNLGTPPRLA